jgi:hypothetical protein
MDIPVLSEVLTALAQGAGGEAGRRTWAALAGLTARICGHGSAEAQAVEAASTGSEPGRASALADLLAPRADADPGFAAVLWRPVTADRPAGVLTDDAASAGQVRPLVSAAGLIVVKSRHRLPPPSPPIAKIGNC